MVLLHLSAHTLPPLLLPTGIHTHWQSGDNRVPVMHYAGCLPHMVLAIKVKNFFQVLQLNATPHRMEGFLHGKFLYADRRRTPSNLLQILPLHMKIWENNNIRSILISSWTMDFTPNERTVSENKKLLIRLYTLAHLQNVSIPRGPVKPTSKTSANILWKTLR